MSIFRLGDQKPPEPQRITDDVVMRFETSGEVDLDKMRVFPQQDMLAWDTQRIVVSAGTTWIDAHHCATRSFRARDGSETMPEEGNEVQLLHASRLPSTTRSR